MAHLEKSLDELARLAGERASQEDELGEALSRAISLLAEIKDDYASAAQPDSRKLEESLTGIERMLDDAMRVVMTPADLESMESGIESQLKPYKRHMDKAVFAQTRNNLLRKQMRERFGIPRLSLFFL